MGREVEANSIALARPLKAQVSNCTTMQMLPCHPTHEPHHADAYRSIGNNNKMHRAVGKRRVGATARLNLYVVSNTAAISPCKNSCRTAS